MQIERKYEQWKAITESDFVTLFIKTWFTFIAVLRELNPDVDVFTKDGMPRGDKPFLNAYKDGIMHFVQKNIDTDNFAQELFAMYHISMRKVIDVFPQYFFQTFFQINRDFLFKEESIDIDSEGKLKERYQANLHIVNGNVLRVFLGVSGRFQTKNYDESIKKEIDLRTIIKATVERYRNQNLVINEIQFMHDFYDTLLDKIWDVFQHYLNEILPQKGYNKTIIKKIKGAFLRLNSALRLRIEYNYQYPHDADSLVVPDSYAIIYQVPFNGFRRVFVDNVYTTHIEKYKSLIATKGVDWFASYVYSLRNALFHEIISPLDEEWQTIFKSAYLLLKQVSDICISYTAQIKDFPKTQDNAVLQYAYEHQAECFGWLANYVELLDFPKMVLSNWKIEKGQITLKGWFDARLKLQQGDDEALACGTGFIDEKIKSFDFSVTLGDDFKIAIDKETQAEIIKIKIQESL